MKIVMIRLVVVLLLVVGIGWLVLKFIDFPGDFSSLKDYYESQNENVSSVIIESAEQISTYTVYELDDFNSKSSEYQQILLSITNIFTEGKTKNFTWQNEKKLRSSMKATFQAENELKDYIVSVKTYIVSLDPDENAVQVMINKSTEKIENIVTEFQKLKNEINSFLI